jgi:hypothetical protein
LYTHFQPGKLDDRSQIYDHRFNAQDRSAWNHLLEQLPLLDFNAMKPEYQV